MLTIVIGNEGFDEEKQEFIVIDPVVVELEHSLVSLSKWEAEFEKPFLSTNEKSFEESIAYIKHMTLTPNIAPEVFENLSEENFEQISEYITTKMTATWFKESKQRNSGIVTAEIIYYWMTVFKIPFTCETWHLNRLLTLIRVCGEKQEKPKKMDRAAILERNRMLNDQRRAQLGTTG